MTFWGTFSSKNFSKNGLYKYLGSLNSKRSISANSKKDTKSYHYNFFLASDTSDIDEKHFKGFYSRNQQSNSRFVDCLALSILGIIKLA